MLYVFSLQSFIILWFKYTQLVLNIEIVMFASTMFLFEHSKQIVLYMLQIIVVLLLCIIFLCVKKMLPIIAGILSPITFTSFTLFVPQTVVNAYIPVV